MRFRRFNTESFSLGAVFYDGYWLRVRELEIYLGHYTFKWTWRK